MYCVYNMYNNNNKSIQNIYIYTMINEYLPFIFIIYYILLLLFECLVFAFYIYYFISYK